MRTKELLSRGGITAAPPGSLLAGAKVHRPHAAACRPGEEHDGAAYIGLFECLQPIMFKFFLFFFFSRRFVLPQLNNFGPQEGARLGRQARLGARPDGRTTNLDLPHSELPLLKVNHEQRQVPLGHLLHVSFHLSDLHKRRRQLSGSR